ncbi:MAG: hypothetical protein U1B77_00245, partial [Dehalococcoidales bacterium]|nr:hypothetical protein [Dehalococcoidales bacterium]
MVRTPCELTVAEAASKISTGELSVLQLVESCLDRIDALEDKIQAWVLLDREGALAASLSLDDELRKGQ